ncbi:MAG: SRPBCC family protein [Myxococcales bacterium]|nr:SRPBCC family protein [Myxococcales bacterium]
MNSGPAAASKNAMRSLLLALILLPLSAPVSAQRAHPVEAEASRARLGLLNRSERAVIAPHLERGPAMLVEFTTATELPGIVLAARVNASADEVGALISEPAGYARFMPALDSLSVESRRGRQIAYRWTWRLSLFTLRGRNVMTVFPPSRTRGYRIGIESVGGDLGVGRMTWRIHPEGPDRCLVVFASRIDMRDANWLTQQVSSGGNPVNRSVNITLATLMLLATKAEAERRVGYQEPAWIEAPLSRPELDMDALAPMLGRGDLVLMDRRGGSLRQISVVGRSGVRPDRLRQVMTEPTEFGRALVQGSSATVVETGPQGTLFEWSVPLPLIGSAGRMRMRTHGSQIHVEGVSGDLSAGQWHFDTHLYRWGEAAVIGWARFDPGDTSRLLRGLVDSNPLFGEGLTAAAEVMVMRSIRTRAMRLDLPEPQRRELARRDAERARRDAALAREAAQAQREAAQREHHRRMSEQREAALQLVAQRRREAAARRRAALDAARRARPASARPGAAVEAPLRPVERLRAMGRLPRLIRPVVAPAPADAEAETETETETETEAESETEAETEADS